MEWIVLLFIVLFLIGRAQHNSVVGPFSGITPNTPVVTGASSGDTFPPNVNTIAPGIPQPNPLPPSTGVPPHSVFPISANPSPIGAGPTRTATPTPIAIQKPGIVPRSVSSPLSPKPLGAGPGTVTRVTTYGMPNYKGY